MMVRNSMTKKHFKALAEALHRATPSKGDNQQAWETWDRCIEEVADTLRQFNAAYAPASFIKACVEGCEARK